MVDISQVYDDYVRPLPLADRLRLAERIVAQAAVEATAAPPAAPLPPLGQRLQAIRERIERAGEPRPLDAACDAIEAPQPDVDYGARIRQTRRRYTTGDARPANQELQRAGCARR
jgi:hypothetical protein